MDSAACISPEFIATSSTPKVGPAVHTTGWLNQLNLLWQAYGSPLGFNWASTAHKYSGYLCKAKPQGLPLPDHDVLHFCDWVLNLKHGQIHFGYQRLILPQSYFFLFLLQRILVSLLITEHFSGAKENSCHGLRMPPSSTSSSPMLLQPDDYKACALFTLASDR